MSILLDRLRNPGKFANLFDYVNDLVGRKTDQGAFAKAVGASVQPQHFVWADGRYLVLHFDLITISATSKSVPRSDVYDAIGNLVEGNKGDRLGGSVYFVPLLPSPEMTSEKCAANFWNTLGRATAGKLRAGDSFFIHYAPDVKNLLGGISHIVPEGCNTLTRVNESA